MSARQPIILIGAARSGTKLLRNLIATHPVTSAVPYDINYIWRLGNEALAHDELPVERLTSEELRARLRRKVVAAATGIRPYFIEKTVSNCLRVPFVYATFPEARFIHLTRDGFDVVESVYRQWLARPDWRYVMRKALNYPLLDAPGYAWQYARGLPLKIFGAQKRRHQVWGPRYNGIDEDLAQRTLIEVCAIQWARCVRLATVALAQLPPSRVFTIRYEQLVQDPLSHLEQIATFAGFDPRPYHAVDLSGVTPEHIGNGLRRLDANQRSQIEPHIAHTCEQLESHLFR